MCGGRGPRPGPYVRFTSRVRMSFSQRAAGRGMILEGIALWFSRRSCWRPAYFAVALFRGFSEMW
jgi:hypothetical protein